MTPRAQIHSWSWWVLICAKPRRAACHCLTQTTQNRRWSVLKIFFFFLFLKRRWWATGQTLKIPAVDLISGLLHKGIQIWGLTGRIRWLMFLWSACMTIKRNAAFCQVPKMLCFQTVQENFYLNVSLQNKCYFSPKVQRNTWTDHKSEWKKQLFY